MKKELLGSAIGVKQRGLALFSRRLKSMMMRTRFESPSLPRLSASLRSSHLLAADDDAQRGDGM